MKTLADLPKHLAAEVVGLTGSEETQRRLLELGFSTGAGLEIMAVAPLGGPLVVRVGDGVLAIRRGEARCVLVKTA